MRRLPCFSKTIPSREVTRDGVSSPAGLRLTIARRIRECRARSGEKIGAVAKALGVSESTVSMWESGKRHPNPDHLEALARAYDVPVWFFFFAGTRDASVSVELVEEILRRVAPENQEARG